jgi:hypothetical protein
MGSESRPIARREHPSADWHPTRNTVREVHPVQAKTPTCRLRVRILREVVTGDLRKQMDSRACREAARLRQLRAANSIPRRRPTRRWPRSRGARGRIRRAPARSRHRTARSALNPGPKRPLRTRRPTRRKVSAPPRASSSTEPIKSPTSDRCPPCPGGRPRRREEWDQIQTQSQRITALAASLTAAQHALATHAERTSALEPQLSATELTLSSRKEETQALASKLDASQELEQQLLDGTARADKPIWPHARDRGGHRERFPRNAD